MRTSEDPFFLKDTYIWMKYWGVLKKNFMEKFENQPFEGMALIAPISPFWGILGYLTKKRISLLCFELDNIFDIPVSFTQDSIERHFF